jgi:hypothetical protein
MELSQSGRAEHDLTRMVHPVTGEDPWRDRGVRWLHKKRDDLALDFHSCEVDPSRRRHEVVTGQ